jgi:hypothetical protein
MLLRRRSLGNRAVRACESLEGPEIEALVIDCLLSMVVTGTSPVVIPSMGVAVGGGTRWHRQQWQLVEMVRWSRLPKRLYGSKAVQSQRSLQ